MRPTLRAVVPTLLFIRDYHAFQGGHLKVADYIAHVQASGLFAPRLFLAPGSRADHPFPSAVLTADWRPADADALFLAGLDWAHVPAGLEDHVPVINLIQHPRHAMPDDPRFAFLTRRATRICVSGEVSEAIRRTGCVNGPVRTIPAGLDLACFQADRPKTVAVLICGLKRPALAQATAQTLERHGISASVLTTPMPRPAYLAALAGAHIAITLPGAAEGFYLPALEAMAVGCAVVCPDALGNRAFCRAGETCLMPPPTPQGLAQAALRLLADPPLRQDLAQAGGAEAQRFSLAAERAAFMPLLRSLSAQITSASAKA